MTNSHTLGNASPLRRLIKTTNKIRFVTDATVWSKKNFMMKLRSPEFWTRGAHRTCFSFSLSWLGRVSSLLEPEKRASHARGEKMAFSEKERTALVNSARVGKPG